ncbi:MAG TPA: hypothetical protein VEL76_12720 [Gemmataceae bacterium]|nr:hypothetical protein [Gemmataceae bacterium]
MSQQAFTAQPALTEDPRKGHVSRAAGMAAAAGTGQGEDAGTLDAQARTYWREQALAWLRADLVWWGKFLETAMPEERARLLGALRTWQTTFTLAAVREPGGLSKLPAAERERWQRLWTAVAALQKLASPPK